MNSLVNHSLPHTMTAFGSAAVDWKLPIYFLYKKGVAQMEDKHFDIFNTILLLKMYCHKFNSCTECKFADAEHGVCLLRDENVRSYDLLGPGIEEVAKLL